MSDSWNNLTLFSDLNSYGDSGAGLISLDSFIKSHYFLMPLRSSLCVLGAVTNGLCIRTFFRIGIVESVTTVLFVQAVLDFCQVVPSFFLPVIWFFSVYESELRLGVSSISIMIIMSTFVRIFVESSTLVTSFLGVQRFLCVAMPLQFKGLFTRRRTVIILTSVFVIVTSFHLALLYQHYFIQVSIPAQNRTQYVVVFGPGRKTMRMVMLYVFAIGLNISTQIMVSFCVLYMGIALTRSLRFRLNTSSSAAGPAGGDGNDPASNKKDASLTTSVLRDTKELKVIKQVALVCTIFLVCNLPRVVHAILQMAVPDFEVTGRYTFMTQISFSIQNAFEHLNSSLNFFVYYKFNDSFRKACFRKTIKK